MNVHWLLQTINSQYRKKLAMKHQTLNGAWEFRQVGDDEWLPASIPGGVHTDLLRNGLIPDPFWGSNELELQWIEATDWEYSTTFDLPDDLLAHAHVDLVADGLDTLATIILNGQEIAHTENMFVGYRFPVRDVLRPGRNELSILFANPMDYIKARQPLHSFAEWNDPVGGSARTDACEPHPARTATRATAAAKRTFGSVPTLVLARPALHGIGRRRHHDGRRDLVVPGLLLLVPQHPEVAEITQEP